MQSQNLLAALPHDKRRHRDDEEAVADVLVRAPLLH